MENGGGTQEGNGIGRAAMVGVPLCDMGGYEEGNNEYTR